MNSPHRRRPYWTLLALSALAAALAAGCSKHGSGDASGASSSSEPQASATSVVLHGSSPGGLAQGDPERGKFVFSANCARCHGVTGTEGGVGPSLRHENERKNYAAAVAWIKDPQPPMLKLYPAPLNETDVENVAAYVETL
jgi:mono/diheme cytochrome c family protein